MQSPDFADLYLDLVQHGRQQPGLLRWLSQLPAQLEAGLDPARFPEFHGWWQRVRQLPELSQAILHLDQAWVGASDGRDIDGQPLDEASLKKIRGLLHNLKPWRKGPFSLQGIDIDTEWRSDFKWDRLVPHLPPLQGRRILDVGGGNGYHAWRMAAQGAELTLCIDPSPRYFAQFHAVRKLLGPEAPKGLHHLPVGIEAVPDGIEAFDCVFSMGVLYHRRDPIDHLFKLKDCLRPGGTLVLETLIIEGDENQCLIPPDRYAAMNNVWFLPSVAMLQGWLARCGYEAIEAVSVTATSLDEQRSTEWMTFQSLADFLHPDDASLTREGHPAPVRAALLANRPQKR